MLMPKEVPYFSFVAWRLFWYNQNVQESNGDKISFTVIRRISGVSIERSRLSIDIINAVQPIISWQSVHTKSIDAFGKKRFFYSHYITNTLQSKRSKCPTYSLFDE